MARRRRRRHHLRITRKRINPYEVFHTRRRRKNYQAWIDSQGRFRAIRTGDKAYGSIGAPYPSGLDDPAKIEKWKRSHGGRKRRRVKARRGRRRAAPRRTAKRKTTRRTAKRKTTRRRRKP